MTTAPPPVVSITLFRSGVAALHREGPVTDSFEVGVPATAVDDVLGSLTASGPVVGVSFDPPRDYRAELASRGLVVDPTSAFSSLLRGKLLGQEVEVTLRDSTSVEGRVLGLSSDRNAEGHVRDYLVLSVQQDSTAPAGVERYPLDQVGHVVPRDAAVRADLEYLLKALSRNDRTARLRFQIQGEGGPVATRFLVPAPVWRIRYEYRFAAEGKGSLVPWGVVHNPLDENLEGVRVTLTTGSPVSFLSGINTPVTAARSTVTEDFTVGAPTSYEATRGVTRNAARSRMKGGGAALESMRGAPVAVAAAAASLQSFGSSNDSFEADHERSYDPPEEMETQAEVGASGGETTYTIASVSLPPAGAATLALARFAVEAETVRVWRPGVGKNPEVALSLRNTTGSTLERGALAAYGADGAFLGQALIPYTPNGAELFAPYARDPAITVSLDRQPEEVTSELFGPGDGGTLFFSRVRRSVLRVSLNSTREDTVSLIVEVNGPGEYAGSLERLPAGPQGDRFKVEVAPGKREIDLPYERTAHTVTNGETLFAAFSGGRYKPSATLEPVFAGVKARAEAFGAASEKWNRLEANRATATREEAELIDKLTRLKDTAPDVSVKFRTRLGAVSDSVLLYGNEAKEAEKAREAARVEYGNSLRDLVTAFLAEVAAAR